MTLTKPLSGLSKKARHLHLILWSLGLVLINIPDWELTIGPFHSHDLSLIIPSIYGVLINAYLFYGSAAVISKEDQNSLWSKVQRTLVFMLVLTFAESVLDSIYFFAHYLFIDRETFTEIIFGQLLMNFIFFYLPAIMYGLVTGWDKKTDDTPEVPKVIIKDGGKTIHLPCDKLTHIESDGNYCIYHAGKKYTIRTSLAQAAADLPDQFVRCHKSFIVNTSVIESQTYNELLVGGFIVPVGREYRDDLKAILDS
ncbi:MAG: hypothetical protein Tsb0034_07450 [Ekhidna sp.]